jgi:hypothetical protein
LNERIEALDVFDLKTRTTYLLPHFVDFVTAEVAKCTVDTSVQPRVLWDKDDCRDERVWWRSRPSLNSIDNLILHLGDNLRQWDRRRAGGCGRHSGPDPLSSPSVIHTKDELGRRLEAVVNEAKAVLGRLTARRLWEACRIQGFV